MPGAPHHRSGVPILTERLALRPVHWFDAPGLFTFLGDPAAMRYTDCLSSLRACRRYLAGHEWQRRRRGFAPWTVLNREDGRIVGWGGVFDDPFDPGWGPELGYWFSPEAWGRGYATELVDASLNFAGNCLGWAQAQAFVRPANAASRRVLEKAGFTTDQRLIPALQRFRYVRSLTASAA